MTFTGRMDGPVYRLLPNGLLLILVVAAGCNGRRESKPASRPFAGQSVTVAFPVGSGFDQTLRPVLDEWTAQTGADSVLLSYASLKPTLVLPAPLFGQAEGQLTPGKPAVVIFSLTSLSNFSAGGSLLAIPASRQTAEHLNWRDVLSGLREHAASMGGHPMVVPLSCPVLVCYYRADLLKKAGLSPPRTWDEYRHLLRTLDEWAPGLTAVEPWDQHWRSTMFLARAVSYVAHPENYSLFFDISSGRPLIETPGFVRALEEARQDIALMPAAVKQYTPADCRRELMAGRAAMAVTVVPGSSDGDSSQKAARPDSGRSTALRVTVARLPGRLDVFNRTSGTWEQPRDRKINRPTLVFGGLAAGVVGTGEATQAAWNLLETVTGDQRATAFGGVALSLCRESQATNVPFQTGTGLKGAEQQMELSVVAESLRNPRLIVELPIVGRERFRAALTVGLNQVLDGSTGAAESLKTVAVNWRTFSKQMGRDQMIDSYRRALGLSPRRKTRLP